MTEIRDLMWRDAGLFRTREGLVNAMERLDAEYSLRVATVDRESADPGAWRQLNLVTVARHVARAALRREESRGAHFRQDFPARDDARWKIHVVD
jgi:L-aspartate oxidase